MDETPMYGTNDLIFRTDPLQLKNYVHKNVEVTTTHNERLEGILYTIDPVSGSIVLLTQRNGKTSMDMILGHGVANVKILSESVEVKDDLFAAEESTPAFNRGELEERKQKLKSWLGKNRIPVSESGDTLTVKDALVIHPPYGPNQCISNNEIILGRVQNLISSMPDL